MIVKLLSREMQIRVFVRMDRDRLEGGVKEGYGHVHAQPGGGDTGRTRDLRRAGHRSLPGPDAPAWPGSVPARPGRDLGSGVCGNRGFRRAHQRDIRTIGGSTGAALTASMVTAVPHAGGLPVESGYTHAFIVLAVALGIAALAAPLIPAASRGPGSGDRTPAERLSDPRARTSWRATQSRVVARNSSQVLKPGRNLRWKASSSRRAGGTAQQRRSNAMTPSASTPAVNLNDHAAAAAYLMKHADATAVVVLDGQWPGRPAGIIRRPTSFGRWRPART